MSRHELKGKTVLIAGGAHIDDIVPLVRFLVTEGWWITGQTILANGGYTTK